MNKRIAFLIATFVLVLALTFFLGGYLLLGRTLLNPTALIALCGQILTSMTGHSHQGLFRLLTWVSPTLLVVATVSLLTTISAYSLAYRSLLTQSKLESLPSKLIPILEKYHLTNLVIEVLATDKLTAYTLGVFSSKIVLSRQLVQQSNCLDLEAIVLHEWYHLRYRHNLWLLLMKMIGAVLFFIPVLKYLIEQIQVELELAADQFVISQQQTDLHLRAALALSLEQSGDGVMQFAAAPIEKRVDYLRTKRVSLDRVKSWQLVVTTFSLAVMIGLAVIQPAQIAAVNPTATLDVCLANVECKTVGCQDAGVQNLSLWSEVVLE